MEALLGFHIGTWDYATAYITHAYAANTTVVQEKQKRHDLCGWMSVAVSPMTAAFAESLGMAEPYGAIFEQPEPGSPAATAGIEQGDVLTAINGAYVMPIVTSYLRAMRSKLDTAGIAAPLLLMQSNGGLTTVAAAIARPFISSNPARRAA